MTKEQYLKHKEVMDWFYNQPKGTKVWLKYADTNNWNLVLYPEWFETTEYIIDDEYAEFRKAVVDGEIIQVANMNPRVHSAIFKWKDMTDNKFELTVENYRIKPRFKVGDWVVHNGLPRKIRLVYSKKSTLFGKVCYTDTVSNGGIIVDVSTIELWTPEVDDYCWFFKSSTDDEPFFGKFLRMDKKQFVISSNGCLFWYNYCEPFIGTLPSNLETKD